MGDAHLVCIRRYVRETRVCLSCRAEFRTQGDETLTFRAFYALASVVYILGLILGTLVLAVGYVMLKWTETLVWALFVLLPAALLRAEYRLYASGAESNTAAAILVVYLVCFVQFYMLSRPSSILVKAATILGTGAYLWALDPFLAPGSGPLVRGAVPLGTVCMFGFYGLSFVLLGSRARGK
jgi:hypothetical protein